MKRSPRLRCIEIPDFCKNSVGNCVHPCSPETTDVTIIIHPNNYAGEDTNGLEFCQGIDIDTSVDLISLLGTDGVQGDIYKGDLGTWTNDDTGLAIDNPFVLPEITTSQVFNLTYNTETTIPTPNGCPDQAKLSFTVYSQNNSGVGGAKDLCTNNGIINLFDLLTSDPDSNGTWTGENGYSSTDHLGVLDTSIASSGDYVYTILANGTCPSVITTVSLTVHDAPNPGSDQLVAPICNTLEAIDLLTLLDPLADVGGVFIDVDNIGLLSGSIFTIKNLSAGIYNFEYQIQGNLSCALEKSIITITLESPFDAGLPNTVTICENSNALDLFSYLLGTPNTSGNWFGPDGYITKSNSALIDPLINTSGSYVYTIDSNGVCSPSQVSINLIINPAQNAGDSQTASVCKSDGIINLYDLIDPLADIGGTFEDLNSTGFLVDNVLDVSKLQAGIYNFTYELEPTSTCSSDIANLSIEVLTLLPPVVEDQTFCFNQGATVSNLILENAQSYNWYDSLSSNEALSFGALLVNNQDYYVAAIDDNGCESERVKMTVILISFDSPDCDDGIGDGVSDNDDGDNDELDLGGLPLLYPNFELQIFNRYGTQVYKGNINTEPFDGSGNVALTLGDKLPTGVYFYVFTPNVEGAKPFQGDFYLSR